MTRWWNVAVDLCAIVVLSFVIYFPRYRRQDLLLSCIVLNIGVLGVVIALSSADVGVGVGFGLFGVLSIIRLRSAELGQQEVAYYFAALALGLMGGVVVDPSWLTPVLSASLLVALLVVDSPRLHPRYRNQVMTLDRAFMDEVELIAFLEEILSAKVSHIVVKRVDLVDDTTVVDVRYRLPKQSDAPSLSGVPGYGRSPEPVAE